MSEIVEHFGKRMRLRYLNGPDFDSFVVRCSEKGCVVAAELEKERKSDKVKKLTKTLT